MVFRHLITFWFPNSSDFRHFSAMSEIWTFLFGFQTPNVSENPAQKSLDLRQAWAGRQI